MLIKKSLKALAICLGSEIELPFANLNSFGKSRFRFRRFKVSFIVRQSQLCYSDKVMFVNQFKPKHTDQGLL